MPFNYFNPSDLAIGNKIRAVFHQLYQLADSAEENIEQFSAMQEFLDEYDDRNYRVARPIQPYNPCRTDEFFNVINDKPVYINKLYYDPDRKRVYMDVVMFNRVSNRITRITGDTDILEGYCVYKQASSNLHYLREPEFVEDPPSSGVLFQYRVGSDNTVVIQGDIKSLGLIPYDCSHYTKIDHGEQLAGANEEYTAKEYECVVVVGKTNNIKVNINDTTVLQGQGADCVRYGVFYLAPDDKITGTYARIFKVKYVINIPQPNKYVSYYWNRLNMGSSREFEMTKIESINPQPEGATRPRFLEHHDYQEVTYKGISRKTNTGFNLFSDTGIAYGTGESARTTTYMCGFKFQPAKGLGVYEDEEVETDFANFKIKGHAIAQCDWSYQGGTGKLRVDISVCDSRGKKIKTIEGDFLSYKTNRRNSQWGAKSDCFVGYDNEIQPEFSATFDEKIPVDGYIQIDIYNKDYYYADYSVNTGLNGFKITIDEASINLYDF